MSKAGNQIRRLRLEKGLTQEQLAQQLHLTRQAISNYETGKTNPDIDLLPEIARLLDTDVNTLIYGPAPKPQDERRSWLISLGFLLCWIPLRSGYLSWAAHYAEQTFLVWPQFLWFSLLPLFYLCAGWFAMSTLALIFPRVKPIIGRKASLLRLILSGVIFLWVILGLACAAHAAYISTLAQRAWEAEQSFHSEQTALSLAFNLVISPLYRPGWRLLSRGGFLGAGAVLRLLRKEQS